MYEERTGYKVSHGFSVFTVGDNASFFDSLEEAKEHAAELEKSSNMKASVETVKEFSDGSKSGAGKLCWYPCCKQGDA